MLFIIVRMNVYELPEALELRVVADCHERVVCLDIRLLFRRSCVMCPGRCYASSSHDPRGAVDHREGTLHRRAWVNMGSCDLWRCMMGYYY